jgi:hypothetical protein
MRTNLFVFLLTLVPAITYSLPQGQSIWVNIGTCDRKCRAEGNERSHSELVLKVKGSEICGVISQDNGAAGARRSPIGYFAGELRGEVATVQFRDSFSSEDAIPGTAELNLKNGKLQWVTRKEPEASMLWIEKVPLRKSNAASRATLKSMSRCDKYLNAGSS